MSRRGVCYDNAVMESFFHTLKMERVFSQTYRSHEEAQSDLFEYIEIFYNRKRRHSSLGYVSPVEFEATLQKESLISVST
jgi:putative transposase